MRFLYSLFVLVILSGCYSVSVEERSLSEEISRMIVQGRSQEALDSLRSLASKKKLFHETLTSEDNAKSLPLLFIAILQNERDLVKFILSTPEGKELDSQGNSALHFASKAGDAEILEAVTKIQGLWTKNNLGQNPLHIAAMIPANPILEQLLIYAQAQSYSVDETDTLGNTPLMYAVQRNNAKNTRLLKKYGASSNIKNQEGKTPATYAKEYLYSSITQALKTKEASSPKGKEASVVSKKKATKAKNTQSKKG